MESTPLLHKFGLLALLCATGAFGGGRVISGGGDAVVCRNAKGEIQSAELFDYFEARVQNHARIELGTAQMSYRARVALALARLEAFSPLRARRYSESARNFENDAAFVSGAFLSELPDIRNVVIPVGCSIEQLALQKFPQQVGEKRYLIQNEIWSALDELSRAGLVLHEIIYGEAMSLEQTQSPAVRLFNSFLAQAEYVPSSPREFLEFLRDRLDFTIGEANGFEILLKGCPFSGSSRCRALVSKPLDFYRSGKVKHAVLREPANGTSLAVGPLFLTGGALAADFAESGEVMKVQGFSTWVKSKRYAALPFEEITIASDGSLRGVNLSAPSLMHTADGLIDMQASYGEVDKEVLLYDDESVESGFIDENHVFTKLSGDRVRVESGEWIHLDRSGRLLE